RHAQDQPIGRALAPAVGPRAEVGGAAFRLGDQQRKRREQQPRQTWKKEGGAPPVAMGNPSAQPITQEQADRQAEHEYRESAPTLMRRKQIADDRVGRRRTS